MGVTNSNKVADTAAICCGDQFKMTLALTAAPDIVTSPTDIVLALDCSGSMSGAPLADMKLGAKTFIDIISESTGGSGSGEIGSGSRIGIVSFEATATPLPRRRGSLRTPRPTRASSSCSRTA